MKVEPFGVMRQDNMHPKEIYSMANWFISFIEDEEVFNQYYEGHFDNGTDKKKIYFVVSKLISNQAETVYFVSYLVEIQNTEWIEPISVESEDEIGRLIHSINYMQRALQQADQEEQNFLQTISHDLKTPIMVIMSHAEAIIDGMYVILQRL